MASFGFCANYLCCKLKHISWYTESELNRRQMSYIVGYGNQRPASSRSLTIREK